MDQSLNMEVINMFTKYAFMILMLRAISLNVNAKGLFGCIPSKTSSGEDLPSAADDKEFTDIQDYAQSKSLKFAIVFGCESDEQSSATFAFVREHASAWKTLVKFLKVDTQKCPETAAMYKVTILPTVVVEERNNQIFRTDGTDCRERLDEYVTLLDTVLYPINGEDYAKKLKYALNKHQLVAVVFGSKSNKSWKALDKYVQTKAEEWKHVRAYLKLIVVDKDRLLSTALSFKIQTVPAIVFINSEGVDRRYVGPNYEEEMRTYVEKKRVVKRKLKYSKTSLLKANDDVDFKHELALAQGTFTTVCLVFGHELQQSDREMFEYVEYQANAWSKYVEFFKVDLDKCEGTGKDYHITNGPAFVFLKMKKEVERFAGDDYQAKLEKYIAKRSRGIIMSLLAKLWS